MTTAEFITKAFNGETRATKCSSVFKDGNNDVYSYGYHYPLLFRVKTAGGTTLNVRNCRGYSSTTIRHIAWSRGVDAIDTHTLNTFRLTGGNSSIISELAKGQREYIASVQREMATKKRHDTQVYAWLQRKLDSAIDNLNRLEA